MTTDRKAAFILLLGAAAISGCTPNDVTLGASVQNNNQAQIVEPDPQYSEQMVANGNQTAGAQERYRKGSVKQPVGIKTTTKSTSSGGS